MSRFTLIVVYLLTLVGGTVRATGSGMGCPDWPRCFDRWIPPVSADQLPEGYQAHYSAYRQQKNARFATYLHFVGAHRAANNLLHDPSILEEVSFNMPKTWTEYTNRLLGVLAGCCVIALTALSFLLRKTTPSAFLFSALALLVIIVQGWFGSVVVSSNLTPWTVTVHLFLAFLLVALLARVWVIASPQRGADTPTPQCARWALVGAMAILLVQVFLGSLVRSQLDAVGDLSPHLTADELAGRLGGVFLWHRSLSLLVALLCAFFVFFAWKGAVTRRLSKALLGLSLAALALGVMMAYMGAPALLKPLHLMLAVMLFGTQCIALWRLQPAYHLRPLLTP